MAGAGSTLGKPKKSAGKSAPPASSQAKAGQSPGEVGPSRGKAKAEAAKAEPTTTTTLEKAKPPKEKAAAPVKPASQPSTPEKAPTKQPAKQPAAGGLPLKTINSKTQLDKFIKEAGERLVVIFFSGTWCETCQGLKPIMREMAHLNNLVIFYEVNVDDSEDTAEACDIIHIPTFQFYKMGKKVAEILDDSRESVEEKIKELK